MPTINHLVTGGQFFTAQAISTSSFTPTVGGRVYLFAWCAADQHTDDVSPYGVTTVSGTSDTWTKIGETSEVPWSSETQWDARGALYTCKPTSGARTLSIDPNTDSASKYYLSYVIIEVVPDDADFDIDDPTAQNIVLYAESQGGGDSESMNVSLGSNPSSSNYVIVLGGKSHDAVGAVSVPTDYTEIANDSAVYYSCFAFYRTGTTSPTVTFSDLGQSVGSAGAAIIEIKISAAGGETVIPIMMANYRRWRTN